MNNLPAPHDQEIELPGKMRRQEIMAFMNFYGFSDQEFSSLLGVSLQAVKLWKNGSREFSLLNSRLIRLFMRKPELMQEFKY